MVRRVQVVDNESQVIELLSKLIEQKAGEAIACKDSFIVGLSGKFCLSVENYR